MDPAEQPTVGWQQRQGVSMRVPDLIRSELAGRATWTRCFLLCTLSLCLVIPVSSEASLRCPPSNEDSSIHIERVDASELPLSALSGRQRPFAVFRITGTRPKRVMRLGFQSWSKGQSTPDDSRAGFSSACEPFKHHVLLWVREIASKGSVKLLVGYRYVFEEDSSSDSEVVTLQISSPVSHQFWALEGSIALPLEDDLPIWGVFIGGGPEPGENIAQTAARSDRALVLRIRNSDW